MKLGVRGGTETNLVSDDFMSLFKPKHEINLLSGGGNRATNKSLIKAQTLEEVLETEGKLTGAVNKREKRVR